MKIEQLTHRLKKFLNQPSDIADTNFLFMFLIFQLVMCDVNCYKSIVMINWL